MNGTLRTLGPVSAAVAALMLSACGGSSSDGVGDSGTVNVGITDGPVTDAEHVWVVFTGVDILEVDGREGPPDGGTDGDDNGAFETIPFDPPRRIDLLSLQGNAAVPLLEGVELEPGEYRFRLGVRAEFNDGFPEAEDSVIVLPTGTKELWIPSGAQTGLKTTGSFTIGAGETRDFTIDFELSKSVTDPPGQPGALLRPTLRLIDNVETGTLAGEADPNFVVASGTDGSGDTTVSSGACDGPAVYVYEGDGFTTAGELGSDNEPLTTDDLTLDEESGRYTYEVGFLAAGSYKVAVACSGSDSPEAANDGVPISAPRDADVTAGETTMLNFGVSSP